jgi:magnesium-transporting ATPase (P-type)
MITADCIMLDKFTVSSNESSLTGEPDDLKKNNEKDETDKTETRNSENRCKKENGF